MAQYLVYFVKGKARDHGHGCCGTFADAERKQGCGAVFKANPESGLWLKVRGNWSSAETRSGRRPLSSRSLPKVPTAPGFMGCTDGVLKRY